MRRGTFLRLGFFFPAECHSRSKLPAGLFIYPACSSALARILQPRLRTLGKRPPRIHRRILGRATVLPFLCLTPQFTALFMVPSAWPAATAGRFLFPGANAFLDFNELLLGQSG